MEVIVVEPYQRLSELQLCVECDMTMPLGKRRCPSCTNTTFIPVSRIVQPHLMPWQKKETVKWEES
jgi:hypothetical protein